MSHHHNPRLTQAHLTQAHPVRDDERDAAAELFARCFAEELWCAALLEVLPSPEERHAFLLGTCRTDIAGFAAWNGVLVVSQTEDGDTGAGGVGAGAGAGAGASGTTGDPGANTSMRNTGASDTAGAPVGLILAGGRDAPTAFDLDALHAQGFEEGCKSLPLHSQDALKARLKQMENLENGRWMSRFCTGDFRYIAVIGVDEAYRGTGVFGRLIDPLIAECDELRIPLCLECYSQQLAALYGSRGFEVVDTVHNPDLNLTQHCMVRPPRQ
ncbi:MAG: GNAT family N-acetyltransferase [Coriobacteriales bacterium]|jgi:GNAT superfamily N-acetyltransferase|nr:GNAT family N-acetyltransferase [Coriobacteriales bacterium]